MTLKELANTLRPHVAALNEAIKTGDQDAKMVVQFYKRSLQQPNNIGARALCKAYFSRWKGRHSKPENAYLKDTGLLETMIHSLPTVEGGNGGPTYRNDKTSPTDVSTEAEGGDHET